MAPAICQSTSTGMVSVIPMGMTPLPRIHWSDSTSEPTRRITDDSRWDAISDRHADALDLLLASIEDQIARGEAQPLSDDDF